eukprot:jgi/Mesvir1/20684/Mv14893-RA.1
MDRIDKDPVAVLRGHGSDVNDISFIPGYANLLLSGDADGVVKLWDLQVRRPVSSARRHDPQTAGVLGVASVSTQDGSCYCMTQGREGLVKCWRLRADGLDNQPILVLRTRAFNYCRMSALPADTDVLFGRRGAREPDSRAGGITGDEAGSKEAPTPASPGPSSGQSTGGSGVDAIVAVAGEDTSEAEVWDLKSGTCAYVANPGPCNPGGGSTGTTVGAPTLPGMVMAVKLLQPPGEVRPQLVVGYEDGTLRVWDLRQPRAPLVCSRLHAEPLLDMCLNEKGTAGASGSAGHELVFFDVCYDKGTCEVRTRLKLSHEGVGCLAYRSSDRVMASGGWDNRVRLLDATRRRQLAALKYHSGHVTAVTFSHYEALLASASRDTTIALWSVPAVCEQQELLFQP